MIAKLRATGGGGFDLAQPSQDRIAGPQTEFGIYKPIDLSQDRHRSQFIPSMLEATKTNTTVDGEVYGVPHVWGTSGPDREHRRGGRRRRTTPTSATPRWRARCPTA